MSNPSELEKHLNQTTGSLKLTQKGLSWSQVLITEKPFTLGFIQLQASELYTIAEYSPRFDYLLSQGYSWINLQLAGIVGETLLVAIETPSYKIGWGKENVAVNYSGPYHADGKTLWNISKRVKII